MSIFQIQGDILACKRPRRLSNAEADHCFAQLAARQGVLSKVQLSQQQAVLLGPQGILAKFSRQVAAQGRQAPALRNVLQTGDDLNEQQAENIVDYVLGLHHRRALTDNPFQGLSRQLLCCIVFDDLSVYSLAERFTAYQALKQRDSLYFSKLIATTRHTVERRLVFAGLLEHFDALLPVEQSIYPLDYRRAQQNHLEREEKLYGRLELKSTVAELLQTHSTEWLLANIGFISRGSVEQPAVR